MENIYLKLSHNLVDIPLSKEMLTGITESVTRVQTSKSAMKARDDIASIGEMVCSRCEAMNVEFGLIEYAAKVTQLDERFLEDLREDICNGLDAFDALDFTIPNSCVEKQVSLFYIRLTYRLYFRYLLSCYQ